MQDLRASSAAAKRTCFFGHSSSFANCPLSNASERREATTEYSTTKNACSKRYSAEWLPSQTPREPVNLFVVFFLTGLWHGASWNFAIWGLYYAIITMVYRLAAYWVPDAWKSLRGAHIFRALLMFGLTNLGWLIFRERDITMLARDLTLSPLAAHSGDWLAARYLLGLAAIYALPLALHAIWDHLPHSITTRESQRQPWVSVEGTVTATAMFFGILLLRSDLTQDFIYFQF